MENLTMEKFDAKLCGYIALAKYVTDKGLMEILGDIPVWSNIDIKSEDALGWDDLEGATIKKVIFFANLVHVPGTRHLYKTMVDVTVFKNGDGDWEFRRMSIFLHHRRMSEYSGINQFDISLEPGVEDLTDFTSQQSEIDDPYLTYTKLMPAFTSRFEMPA